MKKQCKTIFLFILIPLLGFSSVSELPNTKQKNIKKTYLVNADAKLEIDNKYGNISVSTWDEDKIDLEITIKVSGGNENWVNEKLNSIDIDITALKNIVTAVTNLGTLSLKSKGNNNSFEINYIVKIPKNGTVKLNNKYGNISTLNLNSTADISCKYGKVNLGRLEGSNTNIHIEYCQNSTIEYIKNGNLEARYSGLKINDSDKIILNTSYTDVVISGAQNIKYDCNYGNLKFQKINSIIGSGNYLTVSIAEISNSLNIDSKYGKINIENINEKANNVIINSGYSEIAIGYNTNFAFDFDISTKYSNIKNDGNLQIDVNEEKNNYRRISGFYKKKSQNKVNIISNYGNVSLTKKQ